MKKILLFSVLIISCTALAASTYAANYVPKYTLTVNNKTIPSDSDIPAPYKANDGTVMVPLRTTSEALGYKVLWLPEKEEVRIEDNIQSVTLHNNSSKMIAIGKLKIINLSGESTLDSPVTKNNGCLYAPAHMFEKFFNDVVITKQAVSISAQVSYLN
ncbi:stalk domain-containing protein [Paenibacillus peoriae]|uniref:stalk domain-containing protein n=1 Tax=Paenibacillus peoriae TaxID=59893 RepID=UPI00026C5A72|nr:stalk domain-containing protein [Paenibacillus peoriae]MEC0182886.1 stalk domain-containing protein [Paenibacillus peoriae]